jgi:superfamily I DNA/RNA helicase
LLATLSAGWEPGDGRTLFVVGDPMQSIYRFRDAEGGLFLQARGAGIGALALTPLRLRRNFRTVPDLVGFNNALFAAIFPRAMTCARARSPIPRACRRAARAPPPGIEAVRCGSSRWPRRGSRRTRAHRRVRRGCAGSVAVLVATYTRTPCRSSPARVPRAAGAGRGSRAAASDRWCDLVALRTRL